MGYKKSQPIHFFFGGGARACCAPPPPWIRHWQPITTPCWGSSLPSRCVHVLCWKRVGSQSVPRAGRVYFSRTVNASFRRFEGLERDNGVFETYIIFQVSSQLNKNNKMKIINNLIIIPPRWRINGTERKYDSGQQCMEVRKAIIPDKNGEKENWQWLYFEKWL